MNKMAKIIGVLVVLALIVGGVLAFTRSKDKADHGTESHMSSEDTNSTVDSGTTGVGSTDSSVSTPTDSSSTVQSNEVEIEDFAFKPATLTVSKGTTVTWTNKDSAEHNVFSDQDGGPKGDLLKKGESYSFTFNKTGTFNYICQPHPHMKGTITVTD